VIVVVMTSVSEATCTSGLSPYNHSSEAFASLSISVTAHSFSINSTTHSVTSVCTMSSQSTSAIPQSYSSCYAGPGTVSSSEKCPVMHVQYGGAPAYGYSQMIVCPPTMMSHPPRMVSHPPTMMSHPPRMVSPPNAPCYRSSADFRATVSPSYRQMVTFPPHRMPYATTAGYTIYDKNAVHMAGPPGSGNVQLPRHCGGVYGPPSQAVSTAVDLPSTVPEAPEPVRAPASTKSKKKSRTQSKESYSSILERSVPCPNIDVRQIIQEQRERLQLESAASCSAVGAHSVTTVWTVPNTAVHTTSPSTSQHVVTTSSHNMPTISAPPVASVSDGMTTISSSSLFAVPEICHTSVNVTTNVGVSSPQISSAYSSISDSSLRVVRTVSSAGVSPALSYVTTSTTETNVSTLLHITAPVSTSLSYGASWVYTGGQQYSQYNHWSQYSSHPLSSTVATRSSVGMNPYQSQFDCSLGPQVPGIRPYPAGLQPNLKDVMPPAVAMTANAVASSACLPSAALLPNSAGEAAKDESPIRLVQNMVSGLETTQNSLAIAASLIISQSDTVPRRRRSGVTEAAGHTATSTMVTDLCEEMRFGSESLNVDGQTNSSVHLTDDSVRCTPAKLHLPTTSAVTTVTSVLTQVLPAASVVPSAYCMNPLPSASVHLSVSSMSATVSLCSDVSRTTSVTSTSSTNGAESIAVSCSDDADTDSTCNSANTACSAPASDGGTTQQLIDGQVVDDDESTQDCDVSIAGADSGEVLCTTGTQTSTPASGMSNCNSIESGGDGSESNDTQPESQPDVAACNVPAPRPSAVCEERAPDDVHAEQIPVSTSTPVVLIPRVPQASFLLPQNIAFAPNPLVGHGFLQFQPPGEFGYGPAVQSSGTGAVGQPGALGLVHFAAGPMVGPAVGNMMTTSDAANSFRLMTPVKSDSDVYSAAEFLPLMPAAVPAGHILLQNIVPTGLASTIVPFVQPAALCSLPGGSSALFAVSQGSMMPVGAPLAFASVPVPERRHQHDHAPDQPDSTVDNSEMDTTDEPSSDDSADTERVTSTDEPLDDVSDNPTKVASSAAASLHCSTSHNTLSSLTETVQCNVLECSSNTSVRIEYDSVHSDGTADAASDCHSAAVHRSRLLVPSIKKRAHLGRSRLKKMRRGYSRTTMPCATVDQMSCSSLQSSLKVPTASGNNEDALMSPVGSEELIDSLCPDFRIKDAAASDSSVSTTLSLNDGSNDGIDLSTVDKCTHAGSVRKARWKKQARRTRLRLRHSMHEVKLSVDARLSPTEITHAGEC